MNLYIGPDVHMWHLQDEKSLAYLEDMKSGRRLKALSLQFGVTFTHLDMLIYPSSRQFQSK